MDAYNFKIFSFNINKINKNKDKIGDISNDIKNMLKITNDNIDKFIYVICTQEDASKSFFIKNVVKIFDDSFTIKDTIFYGAGNYKIHLLVIMPNGAAEFKFLSKISHSNVSSSSYNEYFKNYLNVKSYIITKGSLVVRLSDDDNDVYIVGSHLPLEKKKEGFGYKNRVNAIVSVISYIKKQINPDKNSVIIMTGDLNFRIFHGKDQIKSRLLTDIKQIFNMKFSDISNIDKISPTCKTVMYDEKLECGMECNRNEDKCNINSKINECYCQNCYELGVTVKVEGVKEERVPSFCDRVLVYGSKSENYTTVTPTAEEYSFIQYSDHNPIFTTIYDLFGMNISTNPLFNSSDSNSDSEFNNKLRRKLRMVGGSEYKNRMDKYIDKYTQKFILLNQ